MRKILPVKFSVISMQIMYLAIVFLFLSGCFGIDNSIRNHDRVSKSIKLGDTKENVLQALLPTQKGLLRSETKPSERFLKGSDTIEIHYMRSGRQPDGLTTDDEFTPYYFKNGILTGIGWQQLGGAKSQGQVVPRTTINNSNTIYNY